MCDLRPVSYRDRHGDGRRAAPEERGLRPQCSAPGSLPPRTLSFHVPLEESSPGVPPAGQAASTSLGTQQALFLECPATGVCVQGHVEESCRPWWGQEQTLEGGCMRSSFVNRLRSARLSCIRGQLQFPQPPHKGGHKQFPTFVNGEPESPKEVGAPMQ